MGKYGFVTSAHQIMAAILLDYV